MLNKIIKACFYGSTIYLFPVLTFAQFKNTESLLSQVLSLIKDKLIPLVFTLALLVFFWGIVKFIASEGDKKEDGKRILIWGVVGLFVMASIWGLVAFLQSTFIGNNNPTNMKPPSLLGGSGSGGGSAGGSQEPCPYIEGSGFDNCP